MFKTAKKMLANLGQAFKDDFNYFLSRGVLNKMKLSRYHLHGMVGVVMALLALLSPVGIQEMVFWQEFYITSFIVFGLQFAKELVWGFIWKIEADFRDARMGMYAAMLTVLSFEFVSIFTTIGDWTLAGLAAAISGYVYYLVKYKKH